MEFLFPAARNVGPNLFMTLFAIFWGGVLWFLIAQRVPFIFPLVCGLFEALFVLLLANAWLKSTRVIADPSGISVISSWLGLRSSKKLSADDVAGIKTRIGMTRGETVYYDVHVTNHSGRDLVAASAIKDKREADWLVSQMQHALKLVKPALAPAIKLAAHLNVPRGAMKTIP